MLQRVELEIELINLFLQQAPHRNHSEYMAPIVDNRQVADVALMHDAEGTVSCRFRRDSLHRRGHDLFDSGVFRMPAFQHNSQHDVPLAEDADETITIDNKDAPYLGASHGPHGFHDGCRSRNGYCGSA